MPVLNTRAALSAKGFGNSNIATYWAETTVSPAYEQVEFYANATDSLGNIYLGGDSTTSGILLTKTNSFGVSLWKKAFGYGYVVGIAIDSSDNVLLVIDTQITENLAVIMKLDSSGAILWQRKLKYTSYYLNPTSISVDGSGNSYITMYVYGNVGVIAKYDSSGVLQWQKSATNSATAITLNGSYVDSSANVYVVGQNSAQYATLTKFDSAGTLVWSRTTYDAIYTSTTADMAGNDVAGDSAGNIYVASSGRNPSDGYFGAIAVFNASGTYGGSVYLKASYGNVFFSSIAIDASNNVYACGTYHNVVAGRYYMVIAKFTTAGTLLWVRCVGEGNNGRVGLNTARVFVDSTGAVCASCEIFFAGLVIKIPPDGSLTSTTRYKIAMTYASGSGSYSLYTLYYDDIAYAGFNVALNKMTSATNGTYVSSSYTDDTVSLVATTPNLDTSFCPF